MRFFNTVNSLFLHRLIQMNVGIICVPWKPGSLSFYWNKIKTLQCTLHPWRPNPNQTWPFPMAHLTCPILFPPATQQWEQHRTQPSHCQPTWNCDSAFFHSFNHFFDLICWNARAGLYSCRQDRNTVRCIRVLVVDLSAHVHPACCRRGHNTAQLLTSRLLMDFNTCDDCTTCNCKY